MRLLFLVMGVLVFLEGCSSVAVAPWDKLVKCHYYDQFFTECTKRIKASDKKLFASWEVGKTYVGAKLDGRSYLIDPVYEEIVYRAQSRGIFVKKYGEKNYFRYVLGEKKLIKTPIEGFVRSQYKNKKSIAPRKVSYTAAYGKNKNEYYLFDDESKIIKVLKNLDDGERKSLRGDILPPIIDSLYSDYVNLSSHLVRYKNPKTGVVYYQYHNSDGEKSGKIIAFSDVVHMNVGQRLLLAIQRYENVYMPILYKHDEILNIWNREDGFVGVSLVADKKRGARITRLVYKDEIGEYYAPNSYSKKSMEGNWVKITYHSQEPMEMIEELEKSDKAYRIVAADIPYVTNWPGEKDRITTIRQQHSSGLYYASGKVRINTVNKNSFYSKSKEEVFAKIKVYTKRSIKFLKEKKKERLDQEEWDRKMAETIERNKGYNARRRAARKKKEAKVAYMAEQRRIERKNRKPTFNIDVKKIFKTDEAKARGDCFRKQAANKKAFNSGKQGWYTTGCK